jgi:hypothetical protein
MNVHVLIVLSPLPFLRPLKAENTEQRGTWGIMRNHTKLGWYWYWWVRCTHKNCMVVLYVVRTFLQPVKIIRDLYDGSVEIAGNGMILMLAVGHWCNWHMYRWCWSLFLIMGASYWAPQDSCPMSQWQWIIELLVHPGWPYTIKETIDVILHMDHPHTSAGLAVSIPIVAHSPTMHMFSDYSQRVKWSQYKSLMCTLFLWWSDVCLHHATQSLGSLLQHNAWQCTITFQFPEHYGRSSLSSPSTSTTFAISDRGRKKLVEPTLYQIPLVFLIKASMPPQLARCSLILQRIFWVLLVYANSSNTINIFWLYKKVSRPTHSQDIWWRSKWYHLLCLFREES